MFTVKIFQENACAHTCVSSFGMRRLDRDREASKKENECERKRREEDKKNDSKNRYIYYALSFISIAAVGYGIYEYLSKNDYSRTYSIIKILN